MLRRYTRAAIYFLMIFASALYHACNSFSSLCLFSADTHKMIDFFFAQLIIPVTALYVIKFPLRWSFIERWLVVGSAILIFVLIITIGTSFIVQMVLAIGSFVFIALYWVGFALWHYEKYGKGRIPRYEWNAFFWGIALTLLAVSLFATQSQWVPGYWAVHSLWHTAAAIGQYFVLCIRPKAPRFATLDKRIK